MRADQVDAAWKVVMPILDAWKKYPTRQLHFYPAGTWGPIAARELVRHYAQEWFHLPAKKTILPAYRVTVSPVGKVK